MTYLQVLNHNDGTTKTIETPLTLREFIAIHFGAWGFYQIIKTGVNRYLISDIFSRQACYTIEKIKKGDMYK